jgi:hypothetical protein
VEALIGVVEHQIFGFLLGFLQSIAWICDHFKSGIWAPSQHLEVGFLAHPEDADISHRLG